MEKSKDLNDATFENQFQNLGVEDLKSVILAMKATMKEHGKQPHSLGENTHNISRLVLN